MAGETGKAGGRLLLTRVATLTISLCLGLEDLGIPGTDLAGSVGRADADLVDGAGEEVRDRDVGVGDGLPVYIEGGRHSGQFHLFSIVMGGGASTWYSPMLPQSGASQRMAREYCPSWVTSRWRGADISSKNAVVPVLSPTALAR